MTGGKISGNSGTDLCPDCEAKIAPDPHECFSYDDGRTQEIQRVSEQLTKWLVVTPLVGFSMLTTTVLSAYIFLWPDKVQSLVDKIPRLALILWIPLVIVYLTVMFYLVPLLAQRRTDKILPPNPKDHSREQ